MKNIALRSLVSFLFGTSFIVGLSGCGGSSNAAISSVFPNAANAKVRFVHGASYHQGAVDVVIDGSALFSGVQLDTVTNYVSVGSGTHSVSIYPAGNDSGTPIISNKTFSVNGTNYETLADAGTSQAIFYAVSDQVFSGTYNGNGAVNFYNFSPTNAPDGAGFGLYFNPQVAVAKPSLTLLTSQSVPLGSASNPIGIPTSVPIGFGAAGIGSVSAISTLTVSQIDSQNCAANTLSCDSGFVSVFLLDGPKMTGIFNSSGQ